MGRQCEVRTIRLDKIRGLSREEGEARWMVESLACYAMSRVSITPSASRLTMKGTSTVVVIGVDRRSVGRDNSPANAAAYLSSEVGWNVSTNVARIGRVTIPGLNANSLRRICRPSILVHVRNE
jgi:hypothetical protein